MSLPVDETAILATGSRTLALGLSALLLSIPPIHHVKQVPDADALFDAIEGSKPILIIVDTALLEGYLPDAWQAICRLAPTAHYVLLSDNTIETAKSVHCDGAMVVMQGTDPRQLAHDIELLLSRHAVA